jgi:hypothetical protein
LTPDDVDVSACHDRARSTEERGEREASKVRGEASMRAASGRSPARLSAVHSVERVSRVPGGLGRAEIHDVCASAPLVHVARRPGALASTDLLIIRIRRAALTCASDRQRSGFARYSKPPLRQKLSRPNQPNTADPSTQRGSWTGSSSGA